MIRLRALAALVACVALASSAALAVQSATVRLPSESTGGGTLGVYLEWPDDPTLDRYADGPPVVVQMHGGREPGSLRSWSRLADGEGFVVVQFVYPGGEDQGIASDGFYDARGPLCAQAAKDVWLFAAGRALDEDGRSIHDVVGRRVLVEAMGVSATSNGTMITPVVLSTYPSELVGVVRYASFWENIGNDQIRTSEIGRLAYDCRPNQDADGNGLPNDEGKNPRYVAARDYGFEELAIDYGDVAWDVSRTSTISDPASRCSSVTRDGQLFFDGDGSGAYENTFPLGICADVDRDGIIELDEDWLITNPTALFDESCEPKVHYSIAVTRHLANDPQIFPGGVWPEWVATLEETEAFHRARTARDHYDRLAPYAATLRTISAFDRVPHFYVTDDFAEVRIEQGGLQASGLWRRLNPDAAYFADVNGSLPAGYPDRPANVDVGDIAFGDLELYAVPDDTANQDLVIPSVTELTDRTYFGGWLDQLDDVLAAPGSPAGSVENLRFTDDETIAWDEAANNLFYDVARGDVSALAIDGGEVALGELVCVDEDSRDLEAGVAGAPSPGHAWFVVVRPNALGGGFGTSSEGIARGEGTGGCVR